MATAGVAFTDQPVVQVLDQFTNVCLPVTNTVSLSIKGTTLLDGPSTTSGTSTTAAVAGIATFSGLSSTRAATTHVLSAVYVSSTTTLSKDSITFTVVASMC